MGETDDIRIIPCSRCGGDGAHEAPYGIDYRDGGVLAVWHRCEVCGGSGDEEIEGEPVDEADLGDIPPTEEGDR